MGLTRWVSSKLLFSILALISYVKSPHNHQKVKGLVKNLHKEFD